MRGLRIFLFISFAANVMYILGLILVPKLLMEFGMAPQEILWARYLVPIYIAISFGNWYAFRDPIRSARQADRPHSATPTCPLARCDRRLRQLPGRTMHPYHRPGFPCGPVPGTPPTDPPAVF